MNITRMLTLAVILLAAGIGLTLWGDRALAAEAEPEESSADVTAEDADSEPSEAPSSEVFIPTEEISEDFAVSFPVDI